MRIINLIFLLCLGTTISAQDAKADFKKINQVYFDTEKISMDVSYDLFFDGEAKPSDHETGAFKRNVGSYYVKQSNNEMVINEKFMLVVDNDNKTIVLDKNKANMNSINPLNMNIDSLFYFYSKVDFYKSGKNKELNAYTFTLKQGPFLKIDVVFDPVTFLVKEITNTYREKMDDANDTKRNAKLKTTFLNINTKPNFKNEFNEARFVTTSKQVIKTTEPYSNYKLLTNLKKL